jgi:putative nucleotidyltransferase with HDIG domain
VNGPGVNLERGKILLVDDEEAIRKILKSVLETEGYVVHVADNGKTAQDLLGLEDFKVVISDIRMPETNGLKLLAFIRSSCPALPVILMTGFSELVEAKAAYEQGAKGFLAKPFKRDELLNAIKSACSPAKASACSVNADLAFDDSFCRIGIDQFISGKTINFPIFIRLGSDKYAKIAHQGEDIELKRMQLFKEKGVEYLHLKKEDFAKYVGFNLSLTKAARKSRAISPEKKLQLAKTASAVIMENLFVNGVNKEGFAQAKDITETTLAILSESPEALDLLAALDATGDPIYTHSMGVSLFSAMIAKQIGWTSPSILFKISTAGLFHDIGLKEIDRTILEKHRSALTVTEIKLLETHPLKGAEILSSIPSIPSDIIQIVIQHHETCDGRGYPGRLSRSKINQVAKLISVADEFCELAIKSATSPGLPGLEAVARLRMIQGDALDAQYLNALEKVLGMP